MIGSLSFPTCSSAKLHCDSTVGLDPVIYEQAFCPSLQSTEWCGTHAQGATHSINRSAMNATVADKETDRDRGQAKCLLSAIQSSIAHA